MQIEYEGVTCEQWKNPDDGETGYCGDCRHCQGIDEKRDVCICEIDNPHADWRFNDNEPCPDWDSRDWASMGLKL